MTVYISLLLIILYVSYIIVNYGIPHSLSETYYSLSQRWIFSAILVASTALMLPIVLPMEYAFLMFIALSGVLFVANTPNYREDSLVDSVHTSSAIIALISSQIWVGLYSPLTLLWWILILVYAIYQYKVTKSIKGIFDSNIKFWAELIMLFTVYSVLL